MDLAERFTDLERRSEHFSSQLSGLAVTLRALVVVRVELRLTKEDV
jgi:hypothetical protein